LAEAERHVPLQEEHAKVAIAAFGDAMPITAIVLLSF
jgi:hypothetical protein